MESQHETRIQESPYRKRRAKGKKEIVRGQANKKRMGTRRLKEEEGEELKEHARGKEGLNDDG
jgi:hypothetical protein